MIVNIKIEDDLIQKLQNPQPQQQKPQEIQNLRNIVIQDQKDNEYIFNQMNNNNVNVNVNKDPKFKAIIFNDFKENKGVIGLLNKPFIEKLMIQKQELSQILTQKLQKEAFLNFNYKLVSSAFHEELESFSKIIIEKNVFQI